MSARCSLNSLTKTPNLASHIFKQPKESPVAKNFSFIDLIVQM